jgi:HSP20 family protein
MSLIKWEPFAELESLQKEMNRLFEQFTPTRREHLFGDSFVPAVEIKDNENSVDLKVELPGLDPEDIDIQVSADAVSITGERRTETKTEEDGMTRSEFHYGRFQRVVPLPAQVQNNAVAADYKDGILRLHMPKDEEEQRKVVKVPLNKAG